jgi:peptide/nickel transport system permease protein
MQKKQTFRWYYYLVGTWIILGLLAPLLANQRPLYTVEHGVTQFPACRPMLGIADTTFSRNWLTYNQYDAVFRAAIPYSAIDCVDLKNVSVAPFTAQDVSNARYYHYLGTDKFGVDVASYMLYGWHTAVKIGIFSILIACFLGILLGMSAAYWGNDRLQIGNIQGIFAILLAFLFVFYVFIMPLGSFFLKFIIGVLIFYACQKIFTTYLNPFFDKNKIPNHQRAIPLDSIVLRAMDLLNSIPKLLLLLAMASILPNCRWWHIAILIGCLFWTSFARLARAEALRLKAQPFVESAEASGLYELQILRRHILPNAMPALWPLIGFGVGAAILAEASISFLGINIHEASWGLLLHQSIEDSSMWWLAVFPGFALFLTILLFNSREE